MYLSSDFSGSRTRNSIEDSILRPIRANDPTEPIEKCSWLILSQIQAET